jgi:hypothetical protein
MAEQGLDGSDVGAPLEKVGGRGISEGMALIFLMTPARHTALLWPC